MKKLLLALLFPGMFYGQVFEEDFDGNGPGFDAWTTIDVDGQTPAAAVNFISTGWNRIDKEGANGSFGGPAGDHAAMSTSWYDPAGTANDWLISPPIDLAGLTSAFVQWDAKAQDPDFPDGYSLKLSPNGGNTVADFTVDLFTIAAENPDWTTRTEDISAYAGQTVRIAFVNNSTDSFILLVDNITVTEDEPVIPVSYCTSTFDFPEPITLVEVADISNETSPANEEGYIDYTSITAAMSPGESYPIALEGFTGGDYVNFFSVYIDWNQNGSFNDPGETYEIGSIENSSGDDGQQATGTITVPADALSGSTRMRVIKNFGAFATGGCFNQGFSFGQTQDYTVNVGSLAAPSFDHSAFGMYPNPAADVVNISYKNSIDQVLIYNMMGAEVQRHTGSSSETKINIESLSSGIYLMKIFSGDAVKTVKLIKE